jgi:hypothetical protein
VANWGRPPWALRATVPMAATWDCLAESVIMVETPLSAVSQLGATHSHLRMMELPRCWCGTAYDNHKSRDTYSDHDAPRTPAGTYCLPHYNSASPDASGRCSPYNIVPAHTQAPAFAYYHGPRSQSTHDCRPQSVHEVLAAHVGVRHPAPACCYKSAGSTPCTIGSLRCER